MPRTPEQNKTIKDKRRGKLLSFALKAFAVNGYDHTAVDDITRPAKCSHGLFYHYFGSKEAVFDALIEEVLTKEAEVPVAEALELGGTQGLRLLANYAEVAAKTGPNSLAVARITLELRNANGLDDAAKKFRKEHDVYGALVTLVKQGQDEGKVVAGDPKDIALALCDLAEGAFLRLGDKSGGPILSSDLIYGLILKGPIED